MPFPNIQNLFHRAAAACKQLSIVAIVLCGIHNTLSSSKPRLTAVCMATVPHDAAQNSVVADAFDMSSLKASLGSGSAVTGACHHSRPQAKMPTIHREAAAPAERDINAGASRAETKVGGGGDRGDGGGGWGGTGVAARAASARGGSPPADEKENMDPVCCLFPCFSTLCSKCMSSSWSFMQHIRNEEMYNSVWPRMTPTGTHILT